MEFLQASQPYGDEFDSWPRASEVSPRKDWREDRWMRFSDSFVSIVSWEEVRKAALGGQASAQTPGCTHSVKYVGTYAVYSMCFMLYLVW